MRASLPAAHALDSPSLINSLPDFIDGLIAALLESSPQKYLEQEAKELGKGHGACRSQFRTYDLSQVIEEYDILRRVLFDILRKNGPVTQTESDIILDSVMVGIRNATSEFVKLRGSQLAVALHESERGNVAKSNFLSNISHEIRTPLAAILGFSQLLKDESSTPKKTEYFGVISRNSKTLVRIIDDILDLSKIEAGQLAIERVDFRLDDLMDEISKIFQDSAHTKRITLTMTVDRTLPKWVRSDPTRIRQILLNLIGNALKFTAQGTVDVRAEPVDSEGRLSRIKFTVDDTGSHP